MKKDAGAKMRAGAALLISFIIMGIWFLAVYQRIPFIYDINDDVAMRNVAAGVITGIPDAHLLHVKYILGLFISGLYAALPGFDWYGLTMIGIVLFAFSMILYRGLAERKSLIWKSGYTVIALLLFTILGIQHVAAFQWTTTAAIAGAAGIYLFYTSQTEDTFLQVLEEGISVVLILLALAIRDDVFLMVLPIAGLCFWWKYGSLRKEGAEGWQFKLEHWGVPAALTVGALVILCMEAGAYHSPQWQEFREYNVNREAIMDYYGLQDYEEDMEFFDSIGFTPEETENLHRYSLYLNDNLYSENMEKLAERAKEVYTEQHSVSMRVRSAIYDIAEHLQKENYHFTNTITLIMIGITFVFCLIKNRRQLWLVFSILVCWGVYWMYLGYRNRIIERVGFALYLLAFFVMAAIWYRTIFLEGRKNVSNKKNYVIQGAVTALAMVFLLLTAGKTWRIVEENNQWRSDYNLQFLAVNEYMAEHPENVYFMTTFSIETYTDNFSVKRDFAFSNLLSVGGWHTFSPLENEKCEKLGIDVARTDIAEKENVYVISLQNINLRYMDRYYTSIYGENYQGRELVDEMVYGPIVFEVYDFVVEG